MAGICQFIGPVQWPSSSAWLDRPPRERHLAETRPATRSRASTLRWRTFLCAEWSLRIISWLISHCLTVEALGEHHARVLHDNKP